MNAKTEEFLLSPQAEEFFLDIRRGVSTELRPIVATDSELIDPGHAARVLQRAMLWLTPRTVEVYDETAFRAWPDALRQELGEAVRGFREVASEVPPDEPATRDQAMTGARAFARLKDAVRKAALWEWLNESNGLIDRVEAWAKEFGWETRRPRELKRMEDLLLGDYELAQLYMYAEGNLYVLDPVARFVPDGLGSFDLSVQPSFFMTSIYRDLKGTWRIRVDLHQGPRGTKSEPLSSKTLKRAVQELRSLL